MLSAIVLSEKEKLEDVLQNSLAVSLRFDGFVDRNQIDNKHVLAKTVNQKGKENLYFLGFEDFNIVKLLFYACVYACASKSVMLNTLKFTASENHHPDCKVVALQGINFQR